MKLPPAVVVVGAAILLAMQRRIEWSAGAQPADWTWPVPDMRYTGGGIEVLFPAIISQEYRGVGRLHLGVDVMYKDDSARARARYFAPATTPIVAARHGRVWQVQRTQRGWSVVIDHGKPWLTFYQHLSEVEVVEKQDLVTAQRIGTMGIDPTDQQGVRHLHFATWYQGYGDSAAVDPQSAMATWARTGWSYSA